MTTPGVRTRAARTLRVACTLLCLSGLLPGTLAQRAVPTVQPPQATPVLPTATDPNLQPLTSVPSVLATLTGSTQAVLFAPDLTRADVAEALRRAILSQGCEVYLITTRAALYSAGGVGFHLGLVGAHVYLVQRPPDSLPFLATDSLVAEGAGVATPGVARLTTPARAAVLRQWARAVTARVPEVPQRLLVHTWIRVVKGLNTR